MIYSYRLLEDGRYGIFIRDELTAIVIGRETCEKFMQALRERVEQQKELKDRVNAIA